MSFISFLLVLLKKVLFWTFGKYFSLGKKLKNKWNFVPVLWDSLDTLNCLYTFLLLYIRWKNLYTITNTYQSLTIYIEYYNVDLFKRVSLFCCFCRFDFWSVKIKCSLEKVMHINKLSHYLGILRYILFPYSDQTDIGLWIVRYSFSTIICFKLFSKIRDIMNCCLQYQKIFLA